MERAYVALGSNLGDRARQLERAIEALGELGLVVARSGFHDTAPEGHREQPRFLNAAVALDTELAPEELLARVKELETRLGRTPTFRNGPREIDLDLLFYGDHVIETPTLVVPHPRLHVRLFVLEPLAQIASDLVHPVCGLSVAELRDRLLQG